MSKVFEKTTLAGIELNNRLIRSATHERIVDEQGFPTEVLTKKYTALAKGGIGCIITGYFGISQQGKVARMVMIDRDACVEPLSKMVQEVHAYNTPIIAQIAHCGSLTSTKVTGYPMIAPSRTGKSKEMTQAQINQTVADFVSAISRVKQAGFDGVQLHCAHGYLLSAFVSPRTNKREDEWGGDTEKRFRIVKKILESARSRIGDFPILVKMNGTEKSKGGMNISESVKIAKLLEAAGCDAIEVSCGMASDGLYTIRGGVPWQMVIAESSSLSKLPRFIQEAVGYVAERIVKSSKPEKLYNVDAAAQIKKAVAIPVIVVGGIDNLPDIERIIGNGLCDYVSMSRPLIIEPNLAQKFAEGRQVKSRCINCNFCLVAKEPLRCYNGKIKESKQ